MSKVNCDHDGHLAHPTGLSPEQFEILLNRIAPPPPPPPPPSGLGNPGPLGLGGFALTTFVLSVFNTGVILEPTLIGCVEFENYDLRGGCLPWPALEIFWGARFRIRMWQLTD